MAKNIISDPKDIIPNEHYLTLINSYQSYEIDYVTYNGVYILQSYIENLKQRETEAGHFIAQLFTIPITINEE